MVPPPARAGLGHTPCPSSELMMASPFKFKGVLFGMISYMVSSFL